MSEFSISNHSIDKLEINYLDTFLVNLEKRRASRVIVGPLQKLPNETNERNVVIKFK